MRPGLRARLFLWGVELTSVFGLILGPLLDGSATINTERSLLVMLLAPAHLERLLALLGRMPSPRNGALIVELAALAVACFEPWPSHSLKIAAVIALYLAARGDPAIERAPSRAIQGVAVAMIAIAALSLTQNLFRQTAHAPLRMLCFVPVAVAPFWPRRARTDAALLRTISACFLMVAVGLSTQADPMFFAFDRMFVATSAFALSGDLSFIFAGVAASVHIVAGREPEPQGRALRVVLAVEIALPLASFAAFVLAGEVLYRIVPSRYPTLVTGLKGQWHTPGKTFSYEGAMLTPRCEEPVLVRWNRRGWHDGDHASPKPAGMIRVLVLGDSFVEGVQVPTEALFHRRLEAILSRESGGRPVEAVVLARSGWGPREKLEGLRKEGLAYEPDLVIDEIHAESDWEAHQEPTRPFERLFIRALGERYFFQAMIIDRLALFCQKIEGEKPPVRLAVSARLRELRGVLDRRGIPLAVVGLTAPVSSDAEAPLRRLAGICEKLAIPYLDLSDPFAELPEARRSRIHLANDGHWSRIGHEEAAIATAQFLVASGVWRKVLSRSWGPDAESARGSAEEFEDALPDLLEGGSDSRCIVGGEDDRRTTE
jgi:hypothetical protein